MRITMEELVQTLGIEADIRRPTSDIVCPRCGHKTLHFDFRRQVFACPACDIGGGIMDAWALFRGIDAEAPKERRMLAKCDMNEYFDGNQRQPVVIQRDCSENPGISCLEARDRVYRRLIEVSVLTDRHRESLKKRGLTEEYIEEAGIRTFPKLNQNEVKLLFDGYDLEGVPGFYRRNGRWNFVKFGSGILIPERTAAGRIQGCQIRKDRGDQKYITLSGSSNGGVSCPSFTHFAGSYGSDYKEIILTEGPLKADVINCLRGRPVLAIPGVNSQKHLKSALMELKKEGMERIIICFDMDCFSNPNVEKALVKLRKTLSDLEISYVQYEWDRKYKGYDDYLFSRQ